MNACYFCLFLFVANVVVDARPPSPLDHRSSQKNNNGNDDVDPGEPLFLTPLIKSGQNKKARALARVEPIVAGLESYSGFITVDEKNNGNMYFWSFATPRNHQKAPTLVWLQGGPGASSLYGLFTEMGPLQVDSNQKVSRRTLGDWTAMYNMIFIDNPVGTGFSFTDNEAGFCPDEDCVANNLYNFIVQFYQVFPELLDQPLYISGESYAGKYVPAFGMKLAQMEAANREQNRAPPVARLAGILVGNGLSDPESMFPTYGNHLHSLGLLDHSQREFFNSQTQLAAQYIRMRKFRDAFDIFDMLLNGDIYQYPTFFQQATGCTDYFNFLSCRNSTPDYYEGWLQLNETRAKIHVGSQPYGSLSKDVEMRILNDIMDTIKPRLEYLLTQRPDVKVLYYSGNLDLIVPTVATDAFLRSLNWPGRSQWLHAPRKIVQDDNGQSVAYSTTVYQLTYTVVRNAGHMVPGDQPDVSLKMVTKFIGDLE